MKRSTTKNQPKADEVKYSFADPVQFAWFDELRDALSPYWSARSVYGNTTARENHEQEEKSAA